MFTVNFRQCDIKWCFKIFLPRRIYILTSCSTVVSFLQLYICTKVLHKQDNLCFYLRKRYLSFTSVAFFFYRAHLSFQALWCLSWSVHPFFGVLLAPWSWESKKTKLYCIWFERKYVLYMKMMLFKSSIKKYCQLSM